MPSTSRSSPPAAEGQAILGLHRRKLAGAWTGKAWGTSNVEPIFHIAEMSGWSEAQAGGAYRRSTLGRTVEEEGFIHCSYWNQVESVANRFYVGRQNLLLLVIDPARVE